MALWGGRFAKETDELVKLFNDSIEFDQRMWREDIHGSQVWARGLVKAGVLTEAEAQTLSDGLDQVGTEWAAGTFELKPGDEDIHTANERRLTEIVGEVGGKLHTGRSRNDQVATDYRLWIKGAIAQLIEEVQAVQQAMIASAEAAHDMPLPGYTHVQHAQPVTWGHYIMSHFWPLQRDVQRLKQAFVVADECSLGSSALAGAGFPIDREWISAELGFSHPTPNSLDSTGNRDFAVDFLYACAMIGMHLSRLSEQLIMYSSTEFAFVRLDDAYSTGSSIMPQKKNADTLELTRGKAGRLIGYLVGLLVTMKGLPSAFDKDLQEDKEPGFNAFDTLMLVLPVMTGVISTLELRPDKMAAQLEPNLLATDLADYLVKKGMPFRQAHHVVGQIVQAGETRNMPITDLTLADLQAISDLFSDDVVAAFSVEGSLAARNVTGGTAPEAVLRQIAEAKKAMSA